MRGRGDHWGNYLTTFSVKTGADGSASGWADVDGGAAFATGFTKHNKDAPVTFAFAAPVWSGDRRHLIENSWTV